MRPPITDALYYYLKHVKNVFTVLDFKNIHKQINIGMRISIEIVYSWFQKMLVGHHAKMYKNDIRCKTDDCHENQREQTVYMKIPENTCWWTY